MPAARTSPAALTAKGRQTRAAIEQAARKLFAERGLSRHHAGRHHVCCRQVGAVFYRYFDDKEDLLAALAESFLHEVLTPSGLSLHLPDSPDDDAFFTSVVTGYWNMFKQNIGIMIAVAQLATTQQRFAAVQNEFRRFGMDIVAASVRHAQRARLRRPTSIPNTSRRPSRCCSRTSPPCLSGRSGLGMEISDDDAIATLATVWKKTLYGT